MKELRSGAAGAARVKEETLTPRKTQSKVAKEGTAPLWARSHRSPHGRDRGSEFRGRKGQTRAHGSGARGGIDLCTTSRRSSHGVADNGEKSFLWFK